MPKLTVDGIEIEVAPGMTVLQACELAGREVPRFCYHERLSIAGNCRMCLVEMEKSPKPIASCAMPVGEGMVIKTNTPMVKKAREGVMEFLLINHPLDCPICDQGGECDLQDQAMAYGFDRSRYREHKRAVAEKDFGPLVQTFMTRCIHCTRCVRFATEVAGVEELGAVGRSEHMEITTYLAGTITSELSGNIVDLCPVGALTAKPHRFSARSWELVKTETVDVLDAVGSNIRVDSRGREVMRVLPRLNEDVNEEWISDKTRFAIDGLKRQRLDRPFIRRDGRLVEASWQEALGAVAAAIEGRPGVRLAAIAGDLMDAEAMFALKDLMARLGSASVDCRQDGARLAAGPRGGYVFNTTIAGIEQADACLLVGTDPRREAVLVNARLRKRFLTGGLKVGVVGPKVQLTYAYDYLGAGPRTLAEIADGTHGFAQTLKDAKRPMLIVGQGALARDDGAAVLAACGRIAQSCGLVREGWNGFNVLHTAAARVAGLDLGLVPGPEGRDVSGILQGCRDGALDVVYLLGADEIDMAALGRAFVIYQGHHGDAGAHRADVILPGAAYTEKEGTYVNTEGRAQLGHRAVFPPGEAREDWAILRALSERVGQTLPYDTLDQLRHAMYAVAPALARHDSVAAEAMPTSLGAEGPLDAAPFQSPIVTFHLTDTISRASETMARCVAALRGGVQKVTGTHG